MDNDNFSFLADAESSITGDKTEGYTPKEQELIHQLVQERLGKKNAIEFESLDDYVVPPKMFFSMIKKPAVSIRANRMEFSMSAIRLFEGVQHVLPKRLCLPGVGRSDAFGRCGRSLRLPGGLSWRPEWTAGNAFPAAPIPGQGTGKSAFGLWNPKFRDSGAYGQ